MGTILSLLSFVMWETSFAADYEISTSSNFISFASKVNQGEDFSGTTVFLSADIDLTGTSSFTPIGTGSSGSFRGTFDGQGHVISGLSIKASSYYTGLFGYIDGATIINVFLDDSCAIENSISSSSGSTIYIGGVIGLCSGSSESSGNCTFESIVSMARVSFTGDGGSSNAYVGGLIGGIQTSSTCYGNMVNCANYGEVTLGGSAGGSYIDLGGIIGYYSVAGYGYIYNCFNYGAVTYSSSSTSPCIGGLIGFNEYSAVKNCVNSGTITSTAAVTLGNLAGRSRNTNFNSCFWTFSTGSSDPYATTGENPSSENSKYVTLSKALVDDLNDLSSGEWNEWLYNPNKKAIPFYIDGTERIELFYDLILLPNQKNTSGKFFNGWFTNSRCTSLFIQREVSTGTSLYGRWSYTVTFNKNGGNRVDLESKNVTKGDSYGTLPAATKTGYTLVGWFTASSGGTEITKDSTVTITGPHTLYAYWSASNYTITFDSNDGSSANPKTKTVTYDRTYGELASTSRTGYNFLGWYTEKTDGTEIKADTKVTITEAQTLYAHWSAIQSTVTFNSNGGSTPSKTSMIVTYDSTYGDLASTSRTGYTFNGWYTSGGTEIKAGKKVTITTDQTIYAHWSPIQSTVTFNSNGGNTPSKASITVTYDGTYGTLPTATKTGYTLDGWFTTSSGGTEITADTKVTITEAQTLYAHWSPIQSTVTFNSNGGNTPSKASITVTYDAKYEELATTNRIGYKFLGWYTEISGGNLIANGDTVKITAAQTLYAHWTANTYTVNFNKNGGDTVTPESKSVTYDAQYGDLATATRDGYGLTGWYTAATDGTKIEATTIVKITDSQTLYAQWIAGKYFVTFDPNGGVASKGSMPIEYDHPYGELATATRDGYDFAGWYTAASGGDLVTNTTIVKDAGSQTLYAHWNVKPYTVKFDANGGNTPSPTSMTVTYDAQYGELATTSRTGYTFKGWFTDKTNGNEIKEDTTVKTANDQTLYAHWTANTYTVNFDKNGGDTVTPDSKPVTYDAQYGDLATATKTGYSFSGWYTNTIGGEKIQGGDTVKVTDDTTFYAHWTAKTITVTFNGTGCDNISFKEKEVTYDTKYGDLPTTTRTGYEFLGWYTGLSDGREIRSDDIENIIEDDQTLYAHWAANTYSVTFEGNGGTTGIRTKNVTFDKAYGDLPEPEKPDYGFLWWYSIDNGYKEITGLTEVKTPHDHVLYAQWNIVTVTFDPMGGKTEFNSANISYGNNYAAFPSVTMIGHTFLGWFTRGNGGNEITNASEVINVDHTLYARWSINNYTIRFIFDNGTAPEVRVLDFDTPINYPEEIERTGYSFVEWDTENVTKVPDHDVDITALWSANKYTITFNADEDNEGIKTTKEVTFDDEYGDLPARTKKGHTFSGWFINSTESGRITNESIVITPNNHTLYERWTINNYTITFDFGYQVLNEEYQYDSVIDIPETKAKSFYELERWCTADGKVCLPTNTPDNDTTFVAFFEVNIGLAAGTAVGSLAGLLLLILLILFLVIMMAMIRKGLKMDRESFDVEMSTRENLVGEEEEETRIVQQMEAMKIMNGGMQPLITNHLKETNKERAFFEVFDDLEFSYDDDNNYNETTESFKIIGVVPMIMNTIQSGRNLSSVAEYLSLLYTETRDQEKFQEFDELYFGMKNVEEFWTEKREQIIFGGIVTAFTDKRKVIQLLSKDEEDGMPRGVLFRVEKGRGYMTGPLNDGTDEILFELNSSFQIGTMNEVIENKYIVVQLLFVSPNSANEMIKF